MNRDELTRYFEERDEQHRRRRASRATWASVIIVVVAIATPNIAPFLLFLWIIESTLAVTFHTERWRRLPLWLVISIVAVTFVLTRLVFIPDAAPASSVATATHEGPE